MFEHRKTIFPTKGTDAKALVPFVKLIAQKIYTLLSQEYVNKYKMQLQENNDGEILMSDIFIQFDKRISLRINFFARERDVNKFIAGVVIEKSLLGSLLRIPTEEAERFSETLYNKLVTVIETETGLSGWTHAESEQRLKSQNPTA